MGAMLRDIFLKPVDRPIDGVIKADDEASLRTELDEYVITGEIAQRIGQFLDAYNNYDTANGVWISGFFGSGKSHLLKMLALLLENRVVENTPAFDIFAEKLGEDPMLAGALRKAVSIPSRSILFNIDQKADVISKTDIDALLSVFQKVFDEMCGYYGKQPHIAQFERDLDSRGVFEKFKSVFEQISGRSWERGREQALLEGPNIASAFAEATGGSSEDAKDILSQYRKDTRVSIEDFANSVKAWVDRQGPGFRLNFFVDEVGQYIADNVKLMTNLQTIAESLNTKCKGQAWIIVTAQQAITEVVGDMSAQQEHDFSKIQARFRNRMPLNSADVAEVIQKRLLAKNDDAQVRLGTLFAREENNLKTLFEFSDGSFRFKPFSGRDHFIASYPFPSYQYDLFQRAITGLSQHNAFEGKHSSVGERSMLGVFQEVAKALASHKLGELATFDLMFEGIRSALKSAVQQSIQIAERNLEDPFAVRVLKALFLVKYVKEFKPTVRNISILMLPEFEADQTELRRDVEEALGLLERNTLIQRNGDVYEFLTNEEKDVEAEIKSLDIDPAELGKELEALAFDSVLKHRKIRHLATGNEYAFSRKLDDHLLGREYELSINVISPFGDDIESPEAVRMRGLSREELSVLLKPDVRFIRDLTLYKQTDKFIRQARGGASQPSRDRIIAEKGEQNARRLRDLELRLRKHFSEARFFVRGDEIDVGGEDAQERIVKAFQTLVDKVYVNLPMLRGVTYAETDIAKAASPDSGLLGDDDGGGMSEAELEVLNYIQGQSRNGIKVSVKYLVERFSEKPYGWPTTASLCLAAGLSGKGKIEARSDATVLERDDLAKGLRNSHMLANILLTPQAEYTPAQLRKAKDLYRELFGKPAEGADARCLGAEWTDAVRELSNDLDRLMNLQRDYPFLAALAPLAAKIDAMRDKPAGWYVTEPAKLEDDLLNAKEDILDKVRSFMSSAQKGIYDEARAFLHDQEGNLGYGDPASVTKVRDVLAAPDCYRGPAIQSLKTDLYQLKETLELKLLDERKAARAAIEDCRTKIEALEDYASLTDGQRDMIRTRIDQMAARIDKTPLIPVLRDLGASVRTTLLPELLSEIDRMRKPAPQPATKPPGGMAEKPSSAWEADPGRSSAIVDVTQIKVSFAKPYLTDESDVDAYVDTMRASLLAEVRAGKKVIV